MGLNHIKEGGNPAYFEMCMRLAFKAQSQSRATNKTLAEIKNPPVVFARQANFAAGHQQMNNSIEPAREMGIEQSELTEATHGLRQDSGTPAIESRVNSPMEAVGTIDRATNSGR
jgi:hypothetical protein